MKIIGHRGVRGLAPENTLASIKKALQIGVDEIEIDLRVTKDQRIVLAHDPLIEDAAGIKHIIASCSFEELAKIKPDITEFSEAVMTTNHKIPLLVEVKPKVNTIPIIAELEQLLNQGWHTKEFLLGSFSQRTLRALHEAFPDIEPIVIEHFSGVRATWRARAVGAKRINMSKYSLWVPFIKTMKKRGYKLYAYTVNDPAKARKWAKIGLAGVITDRPDLFK